jgi:uncharacterized membrane protein YdjX (TVP38/TMEM64 family)
LTYGAGRLLGRDSAARLAGPRLIKIQQGKLNKHGVLVMMSIRLVPVAPYTLINLVAGASRIGFRQYVFGTILGLTPGILAVTVLEQQLKWIVLDPGSGRFILLGFTAMAVFAVFRMIRKWLWKDERSDKVKRKRAFPA